MRIRVLALAAMLAWPAMAAEQTGTAMLFDTGQIAALETGAVLQYAHERRFAEGIEVPAIDGGTITVGVFEQAGARRTRVRLIDGGRKRTLEHFPGDRGNPIFVTFLETVLSSMAKATRGSPFYLRNRVKEALGTGGAVSKDGTATRIEYRPFEGDRNADKLGGFAGLALVFVMDRETPGQFRELTAATDDGETYRESIVFDRAGKTVSGVK